MVFVRKSKIESEVLRVQRWFARHVTYEGEAYRIDVEQAVAVADTSRNAIVVARAGSGKTRTIVAKIVYLIASKGVKADTIIAFVFNANAAVEINTRLAKMRVDGEPIISNADGGTVKRVKIATTFHAFARKIVFDVCGGGEKCGRILAGEKDGFVLEVVRRMLREEKWRKEAWRLMHGDKKTKLEIAGERGKVIEAEEKLSEKEIIRLAGKMTQFIDRAQQKFLAGENTLKKAVVERLKTKDISEREKAFLNFGAECFRRYHWYLLEKGMSGFWEYGTDFNLIMSWASKLIDARRGKTRTLLEGKRYLLIDEYQDFSQLFLAVVMAIRGVVPEINLFVVGDDWQAINRFAGSDVAYFKDFERYFSEDCRRMKITTNYRCDREVVGAARRFMAKGMGEKGDFRAFSRRSGKVILVEPREIAISMAMTDYDRRVSATDRMIMEAARKMVGKVPKESTVRYLKTIINILSRERETNGIMLLHRNNVMNMENVGLVKLSHALRRLCVQTDIMNRKQFDETVHVMTMHKSKGLEAEVVVILEADEGVIPKTHPDTELFTVFGETDVEALCDQKRLFYVAMTRAKKRLFIIHDGSEGDGFVKYLGRSVEKWDD